ncbi:MAG: amidohydrolase family protein [Anaerolineae bacterium]
MLRSRAIYLKNVQILTAAGLIGHSLRVRGSRVTAIGQPPRPGDVLLDGGGGLLLPGLVNAHDHLTLNSFPRTRYRDRYSHAVQWIEDIEARRDSDPALLAPRRLSPADQLTLSVIKNLLGGVTTVAHHDPLSRPIRAEREIRVVRRFGFCHSLQRGDDPAASYRRTPPGWPWIIHLAEGVDAAAAAEFDRLDALGLIRANTLLVHGVGLSAAQRAALVERGGGLIWCPGSNLFMLGRTAPVAELAAAGKLALGSDSRLSGERDLLAELEVARQTGQLSARQLLAAVTTNPARLLRLKHGGGIAVGSPADLLLLPPPPGDPLEAVGRHSRAQVQLLLLGGQPQLSNPQFAPAFEAACRKFTPVTVDGSAKLLAQSLARRLQAAAVSEPGVVF